MLNAACTCQTLLSHIDYRSTNTPPSPSPSFLSLCTAYSLVLQVAWETQPARSSGPWIRPCSSCKEVLAHKTHSFFIIFRLQKFLSFYLLCSENPNLANLCDVPLYLHPFGTFGPARFGTVASSFLPSCTLFLAAFHLLLTFFFPFLFSIFSFSFFKRHCDANTTLFQEKVLQNEATLHRETDKNLVEGALTYSILNDPYRNYHARSRSNLVGTNQPH